MNYKIFINELQIVQEFRAIHRNLFIDSGAGLVPRVVPSMVRSSPGISARLMMWVLCNEQTNCLRAVYKLTNRLHAWYIS